MSIGLIFWILMLCWAVFGFAVHSGRVVGPYALWGNTVLLFILFLLLGWGTFGAPIRG
jgi:succinate-acetate transporter protein